MNTLKEPNLPANHPYWNSLDIARGRATAAEARASRAEAEVERLQAERDDAVAAANTMSGEDKWELTRVLAEAVALLRESWVDAVPGDTFVVERRVLAFLARIESEKGT